MILGDTIVAAATPMGYSGVAIIRISGPSSMGVVSGLISDRRLPVRTPTLFTIVDVDGFVLDRAIITYFKSPRSYTGEDVVEVSTHGNPTIVQGVLEASRGFGARLASPGEFTYRAFLNGKLDLVQAEAVASLINSKSIENSRMQQRVLSGSLSSELVEIRRDLLALLSSLEHQMDILEVDFEGREGAFLKKGLTQIKNRVDVFLSSFRLGRMLNHGAMVAIVGNPNVGKSSLLNWLANRERAIVSPDPGTTRDTIDTTIVLAGVPVQFIDTAGTRKTQNQAEQEGVHRAKKTAEESDLILHLYDSPQKKPTTSEHNNKTIFVLNKSDLQERVRDEGVIHISCKTREGLGPLLSKIKGEIGANKISTAASYLSTDRQFSALSACSSGVAAALRLASNTNPDLELVAFEAREALDSLDLLLGKTSAEDIINNIFSQMCVGK